LAGAQANILTALKPGQITTTAGTTAGTTTGTTAGTTTGTTAGTTTGTTAGTTTGTTGGTTTNTAGTSGSTSYTGTDPNRLGQLAGIAGTVWGLANPNGTTG
jgi:cellulose 1,4-beta-cellobiosidase